MNRLNAGYLLTRNPFNPSQIKRIELSPALIDCIVFWTKNPAPMLRHLDEVDALGYRYYFQFTLTPYDKDLERNLPDKEEVIHAFCELGERFGRERLFWRYDPIILNNTLTIQYHVEHFKQLCERLSPYTNSVTISFVDLYRKLKTPLIREILPREIEQLSKAFSEIAARYNLPIRACCEKTDLTPYGIAPASCIDRLTIESLCSHAISSKADKNQRPGCGCITAVDLGAYNTCKNGCVYCYANYSDASVNANCRKHNPQGEFLIENGKDAP
jgi:DNA repair photolyase